MSRVIKSNRALSYLKTHQYDAALVDTEYPKLGSASSDKALFRAAEALYYLRRFNECFEIANLLKNAYPDLQQGQAVLQRAEARIKEQNYGLYDFARLQRLAKKLNPPHLDCATFVGPIEIKTSGSKGRGIYLTKAVKVGDLLLCEKAFSHVQSDGESSRVGMLLNSTTDRAVLGGQAALIKKIALKLQGNPSLASEFTTLYHGGYPKVDVAEVDGQLIIDT